MHVLPRVRELHERFPDVLTVIGVHAGKFTTERRTERIAEACDRLGVVHPVVNDRQFRVWRDYDVSAWPTIALIDPEGRIAFITAGEFSTDSVATEIEAIVERARQRGTLSPGHDPYPTTMLRRESALRFPTRAIIAQDRLWVADTGHGRVLECSWDRGARAATVLVSYDGLAEPRGLAELGPHVYVADRAGHSVWELRSGTKTRVAGTGRVGEGRIRPGTAESIDLRSPWGLAAHGRLLAIAMAGSHQLWALDPDSGALTHLAGLGGETLRDGTPPHAALAQPTGAAPLDDGTLAFADCESSAVRLLGEESVHTLVGTGLFDFGDRPGTGDAALLQHCEDVAVWGGRLVVADTYNDRLKQVDIIKRECVPWTGEAGEAGSLREPGGVWSDGSSLLVCDTGHHRIALVASDGSLTDVTFT